jgi:DNA-binding MarR family transcriptional regulator
VNSRDTHTLDDALVALLDAVIPWYLRELRTAIAEAEGDDRLTMPQVRCLQAVAAVGAAGATTTRLAQLSNVTVPTMSSMIDGLVERGLVERRPDPTNRRRVLLFVTGSGAALLDRYEGIMRSRHRAIVGPMDPAVKSELVDGLRAIAARLEQVSDFGMGTVGAGVTSGH